MNDFIARRHATGNTFNLKEAAFYGACVQAAYAMHDNQPSSTTPPIVSFPAGYELGAWIQMKDFILANTNPVFYGFIAHSITDPSQFVLAIRGTSGGVEWWDDANAIIREPFKNLNCGTVGSGFARIYDTLEVIERPLGQETANRTNMSLKPIGSFSQQVSAHVRRSIATHLRTADSNAISTLHVTGHSLGAALATLYVLENASLEKVLNPTLCTFASPLVGDDAFVAAFNNLRLTSWRIVNKPDLVPMLPPEVFGFRHVDSEISVNSTGKVLPNPGCWHSLSTYIALIDPSQPISPDCQVAAAHAQLAPVAAAAPQRAVDLAPSSFEAKASEVTIMINIDVAPNG